MDDKDENFSRRAFAAGLFAALVAAPLAMVAPSQAEAQERQFVRPSHTPRVQRPRSHVRGPATHRSLFRARRRIHIH
ncbi:hypothetical protein IY145_17405 [Methylosinus sp. H3A]|uniref:hypothetical protein n=1 Tax=Methylosinus sp. H3A TaxID=2785786 RepID=UPI0018C2BB59|nr:hypothetical protein [Methylosinus sp. H3A]MBG0811150.1 hypothetical protein [Methylosinus sp. H3A]